MRVKLPHPRSKLEESFALQLRLEKFSPVEREFRFDPARKWRLDFAWPGLKLGVEVEGGTWSWGRHVRPDGFERDAEKYNAAALAGWRVLRFTGKMVEDGRALATLRQALGS